MSFLIRQIALKSSGEEIVRGSRVDGDELTIGRDAACGIHLPDLAVDPRHARVTRIDDQRLMIRSIGDQPFDVNGRSVNRRELDIATGAELGFGGHRIQLSRDADTDYRSFRCGGWKRFRNRPRMSISAVPTR
jgi:pSer/pThr/pTyr-binding forkhead associated (FHA) protein